MAGVGIYFHLHGFGHIAIAKVRFALAGFGVQGSGARRWRG
jgi:hypothetical protein